MIEIIPREEIGIATIRINVEKTGKNIEKYISEYGYTKKQIAKYLGFTTPQAIYHWKDGMSLPSMDNLVAIADLFGCTIDELIITERM